MLEIINFEKADKTKTTKTFGYADVVFTVEKPTTFVFRRMPLLKSGSKKWMSFPSYQKEAQDGTTNFFKFAEFLLEGNNGKFLELIYERLKTYLEIHNIVIEDETEEVEFPIT